MSMGLMQSKYSVELVSPSGTLLAELSGRAAQRQFTVTRNAADDITWYLNIDEFEKYCAKNFIDPRQILITDQTEVRIKRGGVYFAAGQLSYKYGVLAENGQGNMIQIRAVGFLNLLTNRYTGPGQVYTLMDGSQIAWDLINTSQTGGNDYTGTVDITTGKFSGGVVPLAAWDFGIRAGQLPAVGSHSRTYNSMALSDALADLSNLPSGGFDMKFDYKKVFNTYTQLGNQRKDVLFEYPGNIIEADMTEDGTQLFNQIIAQGSGNGTATQALAVGDSPSYSSELAYKVRQQFVSPSSLDTGDSSLQDYANWTLSQYYSPLVLPALQIDGDKAPYVTDYSIGDWARVRIRNHPLYADVDGMYRIEQIQVAVDDNDHEIVTITTSLT